MKKSLSLFLALTIAASSCFCTFAESPDPAPQVSDTGSTLTELFQELSLPQEQTVADKLIPDENAAAAQAQMSSAYQTVACPDLGFQTICLAEYETDMEPEGMYINLRGYGQTPCVVINRYYGETRDAKTFLEEVVTPYMQETKGEDLVNYTDPTAFDLGGKNLVGIVYFFTFGENVVQLMRMEWQTGHDIMEFMALYMEEDAAEAGQACKLAIENLVFTDGTIIGAGNSDPGDSTNIGKKPQTIPAEDGIEIDPSESSRIEFETYVGPKELFTLEIPKGWEVRIGTSPDYQLDFVGFCLKVYDPDQPERAVNWVLFSSGMTNSRESWEFWQEKDPDNNTGRMPYAAEHTTEGVFEALGRYSGSGFTDFESEGVIGQTMIGGDVVFGECTSTVTGRRMDAVCTTLIQNFSMMTTNQSPENPWDFSTRDVGFLNLFDTIMMTSLQGEFSDWSEVLYHILDSVRFSDMFNELRQNEWNNINQTVQYVASVGNQIGDMIMDTWQNQSNTYAVLSQKRSDSTLGYERVYDTATGEYYKAENGFSDWYSGSRYVPVDTDDAYLSPSSGTILWK